MDIRLRILALLCLIMAAFTESCSDDYVAGGGESESEIVYPIINVGAAEMTYSESSRALEPMSPDVEKYIKTLAVFEFDSEGLHERGPYTYHFIDFVAGKVDDVSGIIGDSDWGIVEETLEYLPFREYANGTLCLVANVSKEQVEAFYDKYREEGQTLGSMTFEMFQKWQLPLDYYSTESGVYDETNSGHIANMYMFGYYQGGITSKNIVSVDLGRLASRIDIRVINDTGKDITKRMGYHFDNVCRSSYFFPIRQDMPEVYKVGLSRTIICSGMIDDTTVDRVENAVTVPDSIFAAGASHTRYFYVGAHSAASIGDATLLHIYYDRRILDGEDGHDDPHNTVTVPLCSVLPSEAAGVHNGYSLSRNTRYLFIIRLVASGTQNANVKAAEAKSRCVSPGVYEYVVSLP